MKHILIFIGTRPEAIKLAPLVAALRARPTDFKTTVCASSQHQQMLEQALRWFDLQPNENLQVMHEGPQLSNSVAAVLRGAGEVIERLRPDVTVIQGDTTTALAGALAAFYAGTTIAHVEAGLRSGNRHAPWPEEINRVLISKLANLHFAPTAKNAAILKNENASGEVHVVGNTVLDALLLIRRRLREDVAMRTVVKSELTAAGYTPTDERHFVLVTGHRRESFGEGLQNICRALVQLATMHPHIDLVYAVHLNPQVHETVRQMLNNISNIFLLPPLDYGAFVMLMDRCHLILTDSGGVQEEAPSLDKPVLVMRNATERPEVLESGAAQLVGTTIDGIVSAATQVLDNEAVYAHMAAASNPYGDGLSAPRIVDILAKNA
ncbi:UDP-N-acetylglucosamine 2-epimerase (non-hydrolyzing) [Candidatus Persebacteraceae bacterium Df01]|jgi:UDP-N-acetylglucosamine 2-epimerase (non-hydrolysing)|uniref:UDP-N-acetylglucosamine 2-epimerase (non-hydrolyzing) n=1 Tax=Candidatus Doriopsillibacter californiensis TaxID=2970740 RepID=A0ABT7QJY6_9GAMM|nr:UDP-N-acetylglucosamine 2-epimerase (non-hydrolyzing) [Candidatus Persebacteraceae bacterium Df01]